MTLKIQVTVLALLLAAGWLWLGPIVIFIAFLGAISSLFFYGLCGLARMLWAIVHRLERDERDS